MRVSCTEEAAMINMGFTLRILMTDGGDRPFREFQDGKARAGSGGINRNEPATAGRAGTGGEFYASRRSR